MNLEARKTIRLATKGLAIVAFVATAYLTFDIALQGQKLKDLGSLAKTYKSCNDRIQKTGESYLNANLADISMAPNYVSASRDCLKESGEELSLIGGLSASLMTAAVSYSKNASDLHKLVLRPKNKKTYNLLKKNISFLKSSYSNVTKELYKSQDYFSKRSSFLNNNFYLLSIGTLFMSLLINLLPWRSKKADLKSEVEEAVDFSFNGTLENGKEVEKFVSDALMANGMSNVNSLLKDYFKHGLKKHAMEMKFDRIDELATMPPQPLQQSEDLEKISEAVTDVSLKLDLLDSISVNIKGLQSKDENLSELDKKLSDILSVVEAVKDESHKKGLSIAKSLQYMVKKIGHLENENKLLKSEAPNLQKRMDEVSLELKGLYSKVNKIENGEEITPTVIEAKESEEVSFGSQDLETCIINSINEISGRDFSKGIKFDVNVDSGITLGKSRNGVVKIVRELIKQSILNNKEITKQKVLTIKSKAISSGILLNCSMKQSDTIEDIASMKLSSQNFHIFDPLEDTDTKKVSSNFTELTDINGKKIGTRYNFCLELESMANTELPQVPNFFNN